MSQTPGTVILSIEGTEVVCEKADLIKRSRYFEAMFCHDFLEKNSDKVVMREINVEHFISLLKYDGEALNYPMEVLEVACMLHFEKEQEQIEQYILNQYLSIDTCLYVMFKSKKLHQLDLYTKSSSLSLFQFSKVNRTSSFLKLDPYDVYDYLSHPGLNVPGSESDVFNAILRWLNYDIQTRNNHFAKIITVLRFQSISIIDIRLMMCYPAVKLNEKVIQFFNCMLQAKENSNYQAASDSGLLATADKDILQMRHIVLSNPTRSVPSVPCVAGHLVNQSNSSTPKLKSPHLYGWSENCLSSTLHLSKLDENDSEAYGYTLVAIDFNIYIIGGEYRYGYGKWNMDIWRFDALFEKWTLQASLPTARRNVLISHLDGYLYLIGGVGKHRVIVDTLWRFSLKNNTWKVCCSLSDSASILCCCSFEGKLYIFCSRIRSYCPFTKNVSTLEILLPEKNGCVSALPYGKWIYIIGTTTASVYRFEPIAAVSTMEYITKFKIASKNSCISNHKIYHFSDNDGVQLIETFDLINNVLSATEISNPNISFSISSGCFSIPKYK